jgi:hypothetical protein
LDRTYGTRFLASAATETEDPLRWGLITEGASPSKLVYGFLYHATETGGGCLERFISFILETEGLRRGVWNWGDSLDRVYMKGPAC